MAEYIDRMAVAYAIRDYCPNCGAKMDKEGNAWSTH